MPVKAEKRVSEMPYSLSLNTNPLVNRYANPDGLITTIAQELRIRDVQLTHEFINPGWPLRVIKRITAEFKASLNRTGVKITSGMTGPYGRLNHFGHPDKEVRQYYVDWFKTFADIISELGGKSVGTQFAILTFEDYDDPAKRDDAINTAIECWAEVAAHGKRAGLEYVFWEPMSIGREFGETIESCLALQQRLTDAKMDIPLWMMADIDHGDITSDNADDYNPYAWAKAVPRHSPIIHVKQSLHDKGGHRPFSKAYNETGRIIPEKLLAEITAGGGDNNEICLELSFKEREPDDRLVIPQIRESVEHWAPFVDTGESDLTF